MALHTGARKGELLALRWRDVNLDEGLARLSQTKTDEPRILPLSDPVVAELRRYFGSEDVLVFPSIRCDAVPIRPARYWEDALVRAGIENFRFHDLRHTAATMAAKSGFTLHDIGGLLGHRSAQTTLRYAHHVLETKKRMAANLAETLGGQKREREGD
jgi:integrase